MLANPGTAPAMITMIVNGSSARTMSVSAGRLVTVGLPRSSGVAGVSVRSDQPISAALTGITVRGRVLAPVVFSVPCAQLTTPSPVAVTIDPRTGVAAPFAR
jgi:hypothetical protein